MEYIDAKHVPLEIRVNELAVKFRHLRNPITNRIYATVCTILKEDGTELSIGISLCSTNDNPSRKIGRDISCHRAIKALFSKRNLYPINLNNTNCEVIKIFKKHNVFTKFKAIYFPHIG